MIMWQSDSVNITTSLVVSVQLGMHNGIYVIVSWIQISDSGVVHMLLCQAGVQRALTRGEFVSYMPYISDVTIQLQLDTSNLAFGRNSWKTSTYLKPRAPGPSGQTQCQSLLNLSAESSCPL